MCDMKTGAENSQIAANVSELREKIRKAAEKSGRKASDITLLAASKSRTCGEIRLAVSAGVDAVGEVKYLIGKVTLIHSVDSEKLGAIISRLSERSGTVSDILLEVNIGREESKSGIMPEDAAALCQKLQGYKGINLRGLMAIPPVSESGQCRRYFSDMRELFYVIKKNAPAGFDILSIGMSDDFEIAVEEGATMVRIGRGIFGERR
jgi:uncharacterized pyridoxal phosphate-containing UPF0001 family protein